MNKEFLQWCKEEKDKGNKLVMGKDMVVHSVPKRKTLFEKLFSIFR